MAGGQVWRDAAPRGHGGCGVPWNRRVGVICHRNRPGRLEGKRRHTQVMGLRRQKGPCNGHTPHSSQGPGAMPLGRRASSRETLLSRRSLSCSEDSPGKGLPTLHLGLTTELLCQVPVETLTHPCDKRGHRGSGLGTCSAQPLEDRTVGMKPRPPVTRAGGLPTSRLKATPSMPTPSGSPGGVGACRIWGPGSPGAPLPLLVFKTSQADTLPWGSPHLEPWILSPEHLCPQDRGPGSAPPPMGPFERPERLEQE